MAKLRGCAAAAAGATAACCCRVLELELSLRLELLVSVVPEVAVDDALPAVPVPLPAAAN